ncbi:MAG: hypothetical protein ACP5QA_09245 [Phycisphaerae bacterium]
MDSSEFRRVITNGLGRAALWVRNNSWRPHEEAIKHVCLHNTAYDAQCEGSRAEYIYEIVRRTDSLDHFSEIAVTGLMASREFWDTSHLFRLNRLFAQAGFARSRDALYEKFEKGDAEERSIGAEEFIRLDGTNGVLFALGVAGGWFDRDAGYREDDYFLQEAQRILGPEVILSLRQAAQTNANIRRYLEEVERTMQRRSKQSRTDYRSFTYPQMRDMILSVHGEVTRTWLFFWGKHATEDFIRMAASDLLNEQDDAILVAYLRIFSHRAFPLDNKRLIDLARSPNKEVAAAARRSLRLLRSEAIRELAVEIIRGGDHTEGSIPLLIKNYREGDHLLIESLLEAATNEEDFHWAARDSLDVFTANPQAPALRSLLDIYDKCRCSICRHGGVKILADRRILPSLIHEECRFDSYEDTREIARLAN